MDIHAPERPIRSIKEFGIHIAIVTIGILIALSLEGIREWVHDTRLVHETIANFREELEVDWVHDTDELKRVREADELLKSLVADLPVLMREHPEQIRSRLNQISNPGYFLTDESWQAALSTGSLAHMTSAQLQKYSAAFSGMRIYTSLQREGDTAEIHAKTFFDAHTALSPADLAEGSERILLFSRTETIMVNVGTQIHSDISRALDKSESR